MLMQLSGDVDVMLRYFHSVTIPLWMFTKPTPQLMLPCDAASPLTLNPDSYQ